MEDEKKVINKFSKIFDVMSDEGKEAVEKALALMPDLSDDREKTDFKRVVNALYLAKMALTAVNGRSPSNQATISSQG